MNIFKSIIVWLIGLCFMVILFPITFLIWLITFPFNKERTVIHWILMYQSFLLSFLVPIWKIKIQGIEKSVKGTTYVIISNHQSILDILMINCLRFKFKWISKIENSKLPFLGWYIRMADYITVDRNDEKSKVEMLEKSYSCLRKGISIMIFPEGTRSKDNEIGFFKRGAFQLAIEARVPILPVIIDGTGGILPKHGLIFRSNHVITIQVLDPIPLSAFNTDNPEVLAMTMKKLMADKVKELRSASFKE